jgi:hypothetical protein
VLLGAGEALDAPEVLLEAGGVPVPPEVGDVPSGVPVPTGAADVPGDCVATVEPDVVPDACAVRVLPEVCAGPEVCEVLVMPGSSGVPVTPGTSGVPVMPGSSGAPVPESAEMLEVDVLLAVGQALREDAWSFFQTVLSRCRVGEGEPIEASPVVLDVTAAPVSASTAAAARRNRRTCFLCRDMCQPLAGRFLRDCRGCGRRNRAVTVGTDRSRPPAERDQCPIRRCGRSP